MRKPNFFIIGAPKCGTTSLAAWLAKHPQIYMSPIKEPHYYNTDMGNRFTRSEREYVRLFKNTAPQHSAVGEASVWYLYSQEAVPNILRENPKAKFIVMVRNPVEMAYSLHEQQVVSGNEDVTDFGEAWNLQEERRKGRRISKWCEEGKRLLYSDVCALGEQMERLYQENLSREQVLPIVLDDLKSNVRSVYLRVLSHLELPDDGRTEFPVENTAKERRSAMVQKALMAVSMTRRALNVPRINSGIMGRINRMNVRYRSRPPLSPAMRTQLSNHFAHDVNRLESLIDRDLKHWLSSGS